MHELGYFSVFGILYAMIFSLLAVLALIKVLPTTRFVIATSRGLKEPLIERLLHRLSLSVSRHRKPVTYLSILAVVVRVWNC